MNRNSIALLTVLMLQLTAGAALAQRARFVRTDAFDRTRLRPGTFVCVSYYARDHREATVKGYVRCVRDSVFTVSSAVHRTTIRFRDVDMLIIGRHRPEIILFKCGPLRVDSVGGISGVPWRLAAWRLGEGPCVGT